MSNPDPNKTAAMPAMPGFDPNRTIVTPIAPGSLTGTGSTDPNRTVAMTAAVIPAGISAEITRSRDATMANGPAREQFLLEIHGHSGDPGLPGISENAPRTPLNLCLVLDRSGSMEGAPFEYAKAACNYVIDFLGPNDVLSIVTFEEYVQVLMPPQRMTNREAVKAGVRGLTVGNTTNLYEAISSGISQIMSAADPTRATRIVVLSDGDPTAGIKDFHSLVNLAGEAKQKGVTMTFLGFGPDYNEELLAAMAKKCGGNYAYIPRPELIPEVFRLEVDKLLGVIAMNVKLDLKLARWVQLKAATGLAQPPSGNEFQIQLADLERGELIQTVFDLEFTNHPLGHYRVMSGRLSYQDVGTGSMITTDLDFVMEFTADAARYGVPPNAKVRQVANVATASKVMEKTMMGLRTGQFSTTQALDELQKTQALLLTDGRIQEAQEVTLAMRALQTGDSGTAQKTLMGTVVNLDQGKSKPNP